jgi:hypothetical protein
MTCFLLLCTFFYDILFTSTQYQSQCLSRSSHSIFSALILSYFHTQGPTPYKNNGHATKDFLELIAKWEDQVYQRGANIISSELKKKRIEGHLPNINIITHRGEKTGEDTDNQPKIQKTIPKDGKYDPVKQNLFFKNAIEIFKSIPIP